MGGEFFEVFSSIVAYPYEVSCLDSILATIASDVAQIKGLDYLGGIVFLSALPWLGDIREEISRPRILEPVPGILSSDATESAATDNDFISSVSSNRTQSTTTHISSCSAPWVFALPIFASFTS